MPGTTPGDVSASCIEVEASGCVEFELSSWRMSEAHRLNTTGPTSSSLRSRPSSPSYGTVGTTTHIRGPYRQVSSEESSRLGQEAHAAFLLSSPHVMGKLEGALLSGVPDAPVFGMRPHE